jgi:hypothetical protein
MTPTGQVLFDTLADSAKAACKKFTAAYHVMWKEADREGYSLVECSVPDAPLLPA